MRADPLLKVARVRQEGVQRAVSGRRHGGSARCPSSCSSYCSVGGAGRGLHHRSTLVDVSRDLRWDLRLGHVPSGTSTLVGKHLQAGVRTDGQGGLTYKLLQALRGKSYVRLTHHYADVGSLAPSVEWDRERTATGTATFSDTHWYTMDKPIPLYRRKPPKQAQFPDTLGWVRTCASKLVTGAGISGS